MSEHPQGGAPQNPADHASRSGTPGTPGTPDAAPLDLDPDAALVRDFFARERAAAQPLRADPVRWQAIVEASGRPRHPWLRYAVGAAAAAVVLGAIGIGTLGRGNTTPPAPAASSSTVLGSSPLPPRPTTSGVATRTPSTSPSVEPPPAAAAPVPASFVVRSLTTAAAGHLFALGTVSCPGGQCPALAGSKDNGASWNLLHTFSASSGATTSSPGTGPAPGLLGGAGSLSQVRFANPSVGWVFGGAVMRTTDGGATWEDYTHPGGEVIDLETDGKDVVLTTAPGCTDATCHGSISVVRAPVTAPAAGDVAGMIDGGGGVLDAQISWQNGHAFVSPKVLPAAGHPAPTPVVVALDGLHPAAPPSCGTGQGAQLVAAAAGTTLFAMCPAGGAAGHLGYAVQTSSDYGATWTRVAGGPLLVVNAGTTSFAAADASTVLAASGGSPDLHGSMSLSSDGGSTWRNPRSAPPLPDHGWAWVGAPGGSTFYALAGDGSGAYWKSIDRGETWFRVAVAGR